MVMAAAALVLVLVIVVMVVMVLVLVLVVVLGGLGLEVHRARRTALSLLLHGFEDLRAGPAASHGVVTIAAVGFLFAQQRHGGVELVLGMDISVRLRMMALACSIWLLKNSPKFFIYILHLLASTTVTKPAEHHAPSAARPARRG